MAACGCRSFSIFDDGSCFEHGVERLDGEHLVTDARAERFDEGVLAGGAGFDEVPELHPRKAVLEIPRCRRGTHRRNTRVLTQCFGLELAHGV